MIPSGTYCASELFTLSGSNISGDITVLAPKIEVYGDNNHFTPFAANNVLFFRLPIEHEPGGRRRAGTAAPPPTVRMPPRR